MNKFEFWTDERVRILTEMCAANGSNADIADVIGCSPAAVSGKALRLKLPPRPNPLGKLPAMTPEQRNARKVQTNRERRHRLRAENPIQPKAKVFKFSTKPATPEQIAHRAIATTKACTKFEEAADLAIAPRHWESRGRGECKFPINRDGETWSCCNATEGTYCDAHKAVMYLGAPAIAWKVAA